MGSALLKRLDNIEAKVRVSTGSGDTTPIGFVSNEGQLIKSIKSVDGKWIEVDEEPKAYFSHALEPMFTRPKRFIILVGGRGSGKSIGVGDYVTIDMHDQGNNWLCLREFQRSIKDSVHGMLKEEYKRIELEGFSSTDSAIRCDNGAQAAFAGLARNPDSVKSAFGFKGFWVEEAQTISETSLKILTPTARNKPVKGLPADMKEIEGEEVDLSSVTMVFCANPGSSEDPFSKRFINPFKSHLDAYGIYEDDLHLIIKVNYTDNPWYSMSGLEEERGWDYENLDRALYDHIWEGDFNDSVENALILSEWFDACVDAHLKLNFKPNGVKQATHDPSDLGGDTKGYSMRHGSVVLDIQEKLEGTVNDGGHWAAGLAISQGVDTFSWDGDGMGLALNEQMSTDFEGKNCVINMFRGSEGPDFPEAIYNPAVKAPVQNLRTNKETFKNKRAQYYFMLRDKIYNTYRAVIHNEYQDPDKLISFSSEIDILSKVKAELCRMPIKPNGNGLFELYTKQEMKTKFKMASPNLGDSVMMLQRFIQPSLTKPRIPSPIRPMGRR